MIGSQAPDSLRQPIVNYTEYRFKIGKRKLERSQLDFPLSALNFSAEIARSIKENCQSLFLTPNYLILFSS